MRRMWNTVRGERLSRDLDRELASHIAESTEALIASGMSPDDAAREARRRFGNAAVQKERTRDADVASWLESVLADLRYALRALRAAPGFALVAILSLALGIGANTAIFSLIDAVMLRSLPVHAPEQLVQITHGTPDDPTNPVFTNPLYEQFRDRQRLFDGVFASSATTVNLAPEGEVRSVNGEIVSGSYFPVLGVRPQLGRLLIADDDRRGCAPRVVLGHGMWQREFGGASDVVGRALAINGTQFEIVGVANDGFTGVRIGRSAELFVPICTVPTLEGRPETLLENRSYWFLSVLVRTREGGPGSAQRSERLAALGKEVFPATLPANWRPEHQADYLASIFASRQDATGLSALRGTYRAALFVLMGIVGVVLLIACANVANLLLARAAARQREVAIRMAIGAGRWRIVRQLLTESVLLSLAGAVLGVLFAQWTGRLLVGQLTTNGEQAWLDLSPNLQVLGFTVAVAVGTALLFGMAPAWRAARVDGNDTLRAAGAGRGIVEGHTRFGARQALVIGQVALSLVLVAGAALLVGSLYRMTTLDAGFDRHNLLLVGVEGRAGASREATAGLRMSALERVRALPGVQSASAAAITPVSGIGWNDLVKVDGFVGESERDALVWFNAVSDDHFRTMGTPLLAGRAIATTDRSGSERVAVVSETMANRFFASSVRAVGQVFMLEPPDREPVTYRVVGVVADAKYRRMTEEPQPVAYVALAQESDGPPMFNLAVRTKIAPPAMFPAIAQALRDADPGLRWQSTTLSEQVDASLARPRLLATLSGFFGILALLLAVIGLYGTMAYSVVRRRGEIGIRLALGAARSRVLRLVLGEAGWLVAAGLAVGIGGTIAATRFVESFLYGVTPTDATTLAASAGGLGLVALVASLVPAWRASRVDPMRTLRVE